MSHFKSFLLGITVAFSVYYLTKKRANGMSIFDEILDNPDKVMAQAKDYAVKEVVQTVKNKIS